MKRSASSSGSTANCEHGSDSCKRRTLPPPYGPLEWTLAFVNPNRLLDNRLQSVLDECADDALNPDSPDQIMQFFTRDGDWAAKWPLSMLSKRSDLFNGIRGIPSCKEFQEGKILVDGNVDEVKVFVRFLISGRVCKPNPNVSCKVLWNLAEMYQVEGMQDWLAKRAVFPSNIVAAASFAFSVKESSRGDIFQSCRRVIESSNSDDFHGFLAPQIVEGVCCKALTLLIRQWQDHKNSLPREKRSVQALMLIDKWLECNKEKQQDALSMLSLVNFGIISHAERVSFVAKHAFGAYSLMVEIIPEKKTKILEDVNPFDDSIYLLGIIARMCGCMTTEISVEIEKEIGGSTRMFLFGNAGIPVAALGILPHSVLRVEW